MPKIKILRLIFISFFITFIFIRPQIVLADASLSQEELEKVIDPQKDSQYTMEDNGWAFFTNVTNFFNISLWGPTTQSLQASEGPGAIPKLSSIVGGMISEPPVSSKEYFADLGTNLGLLPATPAYAQGIGWKALSPLLPIWKAFRNIAYLAFVIIFVVVGFMIIFRAKLNPQTVVSLQAALPNIVVTLLLVTFSYAIAGLMVDLIYIGLYLIVGVFKMGGLIINPQYLVDLITTQNPFGLIHHGAKVGSWTSLIMEGPAKAIQDTINLGILGFQSTDKTLGWFTGGLIKLMISVAVLFSLFRLFFSLLMSYLSIILSVIFAPINLLFNALPGSDAFMGWLKNLFANVIVFPAVAALFIIAAVLIGPQNFDSSMRAACNSATIDSGSKISNNPWCVEEGVGFYPQIEGNQEVWSPPLMAIGGNQANNFQGLIALGMIMMAPQVLAMIKKLMKVESPVNFGGTVLAGIMAGPKMVAAVPQTAFDLGVKGSYMGVGPFAGHAPAHIPLTGEPKAEVKPS